MNSGDDIMYLEVKGHNMGIEPSQISNENYIYNMIPRGIVEIGGMNLVGDQLTNPYTRGDFQLEYDENIYSLSAEFRRIPMTIGITLKYYLDSYTDALNLIQQIIEKIAFVRTFKVVYLGKTITCSYKMPESQDIEKNITIDGGTTDSKAKSLSMEFEIETNFPVFEPRTVIDNGNIIKKLIHETFLPDEDKIINIIPHDKK